MDWYRWHNGTTIDPKWRVIARRAGVRLAEVVAVWAAMCECANQATERGTLESWNDEDAAAALGMEPEQVRAIREAMEGKTLEGGRLTLWRQPKGAAPGRPSTEEWEEIRRAVFIRDDFTCRYCGARGVRLECDHIVPVVRGGRNTMDNLAAACVPCNRSKGPKLLSEWQRLIPNAPREVC